MIVTVVDDRLIGIVVCIPSQDLFYNFDTTAYEKPFVNTKHLRMFVSMDSISSVFKRVQWVNIGNPLLQRTDAVALIVTISNGNIIDVVDSWTLPNPTPMSALGGIH